MEYHTSMMLDISFITKYIRPDIITGVHIYILTIPIKINLMKKLPQVKTYYSKFVGICMFANLIKTYKGKLEVEKLNFFNGVHSYYN
jgi:hypothetical protein